MLASMRAELLVLRKWPAAWGLLLLTPLLTLTVSYLVPLVQYVTLNPAGYAQLGTPAELLPIMLPSQFVIAATGQFVFSGTAPFVVLGAVMAAGDWDRGTIKTALLQGPGRLRTFAGQALALAAALLASVAVTFALSAGASAAIRALEAGSAAAGPGAYAWPAAAAVARGLGAALLIAIVYGAAGLALGTVCRNSGAAVAVALLWTVIIQGNLDELALETGGLLRTISNSLPDASAVTLTSLFGSPGGGASSQSYYPVRPVLAVGLLAAYTLAFLALAMVVLRRRDAVPGGSRRLGLRRQVPSPRAGPASPGIPAGRAGQGGTGVLAALRAELLVMGKRPAVWALVLLLPADMLIDSYLTQYIYYRTAATGLIQGLDPQQILSGILPGRYLTAVLSSLGGSSSDVFGGAVLVLLGALVTGSDWSQGTVKTAMLHGSGRLRTCLGQDLAVMIAIAASVALTFLAAAAASTVVALSQPGSLPADNSFPGLPQLAGGLAAALILSLAYGAIGLALGTLLRSAWAAIAVVLMWSVLVEPTLNGIAPRLHGVILRVYEILPDASANTLLSRYGTANAGPVASPGPAGALLDPALAFLIAGLYAAALLVGPALVTKHRDLS